MAIESWAGDGDPPAGQGWTWVGSPRNGGYQRDTTPAIDPTPGIIQQIAKQYNLPADKIIPNYETIGGSKSDKQQLYSFSYIDPVNNTYTNFDPSGKFLETHQQGTVGGSIFDSIFGGIAAAGKPLTDVVGAVGKAANDNPLLTAALITAGVGALGAGGISLDVADAAPAATGGADAAAAQTAAAAPSAALPMGGSLTPIAGAAASPVATSTAAGTSLGDLAAAAPAGAAVPAAGATLTPAAIESLTGTPGYGVNAAAQAAAPSLGISPSLVGAGAGLGAAAMPAAGLSQAAINEAVASGTAPGSAGAALGQYLPADAAAAAAGTTGAGSALNSLATAGNASALTDALSSGSSGLTGLLSSAGNAIGGLSGTQLAALGTGAAGLYNASATRQAMQDAIGATQAANAASQGTLGNIYNQQLGYQAPYQAAGVGAVNQLADMNPYLTHQFNAADLQAGLAPNYDFMLQQGQQANQRAANVGGGALGGNALTGLNQYTQNYAGNAYQNAFNNYQAQRQNIYSDLAGIAGIGQTANTGAGTAGTNYGTGITNLNTSLANAQSANILGQAQVGAGGVSNATNSAFLASLLGQSTPTAGTSSSGTSISDIAKLLTGIKGLTG